MLDLWKLDRQDVPKRLFPLDCLILEDVADNLCRNVRDYLQINTA